MERTRIFAAALAGVLTLCSFAPPLAHAESSASEDNLSAPLANATLSRARQLLRTGRIVDAEHLVDIALSSAPDDSLLCLAGEIQLRRANFTGASAAFTAALQRNSENARAHWGLGRIDQFYFRPDSARAHFARAFSLDFHDTDIILSFAEYVSDPAARATLLRNVAALARQDQPERAGRAIAELSVLQRLQGRTPAHLASAYTVYRLPLTGFRPLGSSQIGVLVAVRINSGKSLHLLLDTGARGLSIDSHAARNLDLETIASSGLQGLGDSASAGSRLTLARTVTFGNLAFEECLIEVSDHSLTTGADGVLGADLFESFQIHLNPAERLLELTPFESPISPSATSISALGHRNLLFVHAGLETGKEGLFLVDTGSGFTSVSRDLLPAALPQGLPVGLQGAQGPLAGGIRLASLEIQVAGKSVVDAPVALDLHRISQLEGVEISGILGYSLLGRSSSQARSPATALWSFPNRGEALTHL